MLKLILPLALILAFSASASAQLSGSSQRLQDRADKTPRAIGGIDKEIDNEGLAGPLMSLRVQSKDSNEFALVHGAITVRIAKSTLEETYLWGGSVCPGKNLGAFEVALLSEALANKMRITPNWKPGVGTLKCLTAFELRNK